jgi:hypothetical protein
VPGGRQRRLEALAPVSAGVESEQVRLVVAQEGDPAVAELEQVLSGHPPAFHVVDRDARKRVVRAVEQYDRHAGAKQPQRLPVGRRERDREHPVDASASRQRAEQVPPLVGALDVVQDQLVALVRQHARDAAQPLDHRGGGEERRDDADRVRAARREGARGRARLVVERGDRLENAPARLRAHRR